VSASATLIPHVGAMVASTAAAKNLISGISGIYRGFGSLASANMWEILAADVGGFEFDFRTEQRVDASSDITEHYTEDNHFFQDHAALKPTQLTMRGFVSDLAQTKRKSYGFLGIGQLMAALAPVTPYVSRYAPGASRIMGKALSEIDKVDRQLTQIGNLAGSIMKLIAPKVFPTKCQSAYKKLEELRQAQCPFMVIQPFTARSSKTAFEFMLIKQLTLVSPSDTLGQTEVTIVLQEIRTLPPSTATSNPRNQEDTTQQGGKTNGSLVEQSAAGPTAFS